MSDSDQKTSTESESGIGSNPEGFKTPDQAEKKKKAAETGCDQTV